MLSCVILEYYSPVKRNRNFDTCYNTMDLENMLSEANQAQTDKEYMIPLRRVIWSRQIHEI